MIERFVSVLGGSDQMKALATLTSAFTDDPVERWLYPEDETYRQNFPAFATALGGKAFGMQTAWALNECRAVALWLPPGVEPDNDAVGEILTDTVSPAKHQDMFAVLEQMSSAHPSTPHWYLAWLGVDISAQGTGLGGQLLTACLQTVDENNGTAYLETPNPRTVNFYRRHGFEVTATAQTGTCPPLTCMLRHAR